MLERETITVEVGNSTLKFETGKIARQANGAVLVHSGETVVFASACASKEPPEGVDFFPLRVDYQEKFSSCGRTPGGFIKRENRPAEREILTCRLIDRPLRPMFEDGYYNEVQILSYVYSYDGQNLPDVLAICAASAALTISDIPLIKPVGAVRVGKIEGQFVINPTKEELPKSTLDLVLAGTEDAILMIEGYCDFLPEEEVLQAIETGHKAIASICHALGDWAKKIGKEKKKPKLHKLPEDLKASVESHAKASLESALDISEKLKREEAISNLKDEVISKLCPEGEEAKHPKGDIVKALKDLQANIMRKRILNEKRRVDGRGLTEIRQIDVEQSILPRTHGSSLFTRGETQSVAVCTLGGEASAQRYEDLHGDANQRFYLQYSFPPFSVGEVGRAGPPGRREIGHGKLAERSLSAILPAQDKFPYVIRLESNITESNGSSSMASVCGGCLAMMDAGVPIQRPVAGIAMGLVLEGDNFAILSDILGTEDALGDMDFKVAGDKNGITAFQMDIKVEGITPSIMKAALLQAKQGREHILQKMLDVCPSYRTEMSSHAPRIERLQIKPSKIGIVIGPGGKQIRSIIEETGAEIDINDEGIVSIASSDAKAMEKAKAIITGLTAEAEIGKVYHGKITSVVQFGLFVEIFPGKEGLCHISEISHERIENIQDTPYKPGDTLDVKVLDISDQGKIKLSHKVLLEKKQKPS